jgi:hypothetical protein
MDNGEQLITEEQMKFLWAMDSNWLLKNRWSFIGKEGQLVTEEYMKFYRQRRTTGYWRIYEDLMDSE